MSDVQQRESSFDRHDQTVFDLSMDYDDDDQVLLDWEQYAGMKRVKCCGLDCTALVTCLPCASYLPPSWWYQLNRRQKRLFWWVCGGFLAALVIILAIIALPSSSKAAADNASDQTLNATRTAFLSQYSLCQWDEWRLPSGLKPIAYNVSLNVQLQEPFAVTGTVQIQLHVKEDTPCIVLHTSRMNISAVSLLDQEGPGEARRASLLICFFMWSSLTASMILNFVCMCSLAPCPACQPNLSLAYLLSGLQPIFTVQELGSSLVLSPVNACQQSTQSSSQQAARH